MTDIGRTALPAQSATDHPPALLRLPCPDTCTCDDAVDRDLARLIIDLAEDLALVRARMDAAGRITARLLDERGALVNLPVHVASAIAWRLQRAFPGVAWDTPHDFHPSTARLTAAMTKGC